MLPHNMNSGNTRLNSILKYTLTPEHSPVDRKKSALLAQSRTAEQGGEGDVQTVREREEHLMCLLCPGQEMST